MNVETFPSADAAADRAAELIALGLQASPRLVLGLATGATPAAVYKKLVERHRKGGLSFAGATAFGVDEYVGLPPSDRRSYAHYLSEHLYTHVDIDRSNAFVPDGMAADAGAEAQRYERLIAAKGGIGLLLLGIGLNGHIGFNEPPGDFTSRTHVATLATVSRRAHTQYFGGESAVPAQAITMGIGTILAARRIILLATGIAKAGPVRQALLEPVSPACPASALRSHGDSICVLDEAAASALMGQTAG